jgi:uncharacterized protein YgiM (DUF1202 family)
MGSATVATLVMVSAPAASALPQLKARESVKIRVTTSKSSTALGLLPKGAKAKVADDGDGHYKSYWGKKHNFCGSKGTINDNEWYKVTYKGITGYVAQACML